MKRGAPRCDKMRDLAKRLQVPLHSAVGIMEMLWHYVGQETPRGNIGIATDLEIAQACHWEKRPAVLVQALVDSRWLDSSEEHRLIVHDWPDHADNSVKKWLSRNGKSFLPEYGQKNGQCPEKCLDIVQKNFDPPRAGLARLGSSSSEGVQGKPIDDLCDEYIQAYPERGRKKQGLVERWYAENVGRCVDPGKLHAEIMAGLERAKVSDEWTKLDGKYLCGMHTFLEAKRWLEAWPGSEYRETPLTNLEDLD